MNILHIIFLSPCLEEFESFRDALIPEFSRYHELEFEFLHAHQLSDAVNLLHHHSATTVAIAVHHTAYKHLHLEDIPRFYQQLQQASDGLSSIFLVGDRDNLANIARVVIREIDRDRLIDQSSPEFVQSILNKINESIAKKNSNGRTALNIQIVRFEERLKAEGKFFRARLSSIEEDVDDIKSHLRTLNLKLFTYNPDTTQTPPLIEQFKSMQQTLGDVNGALAQIDRKLEILNRNLSVERKRIKALEDWRKRIEDRLHTINSLIGSDQGKWITRLLITAIGAIALDLLGLWERVLELLPFVGGS